MKKKLSLNELKTNFSLSTEEVDLVSGKRGANKLGFTVLLKYFQNKGKFPNHKREIPDEVISHIAEQLHLQKSLFRNYSLHNRSVMYHRAEIRKYLGIRESTVEDANELTNWLVTNKECYDHKILKIETYKRFRELKLEPPSKNRVNRIILSAISSYETTLFKKITEKIPMGSLEKIDKLINTLSENEDIDIDKNPMSFSEIRAGVGKPSIDSMFKEIDKLRTIKNLGLPKDMLTDFPQKLLEKYKLRVASETITEINRHKDSNKYPLLGVYFWLRSREITDNIIELLGNITHRIGVKAERKIEKKYIKDFKKINNKNSILLKLADKSLEVPEGIIEYTIYPVVSKDTLENLVKELKSTGFTYKEQVHTTMKSSYARHYRRMIPQLLDILELNSNNNAHKPVIKALEIIKQNIGSKTKYYYLKDGIPIAGVISTTLEDIVIEQDSKGNDRIERTNFEICTLQTLREKLKCKEIWEPGANKYRNPDEDLPKDFDTKRQEYYKLLKLPINKEIFINRLKKCLKKSLNRNMDKN